MEDGWVPKKLGIVLWIYLSFPCKLQHIIDLQILSL